MIELRPGALTAEDFAPYGEVIDTAEAGHYPINEGTTERYHDLAAIDVAEADGRPLLNIFRGQPRELPMRIAMMERHPLGSQAFVPLGIAPWLVVVARAGDPPGPHDLRAFLARPDQGVNYRRGVWHHPLIALEAVCDFLVIDRGGGGENCEEHALDPVDPVTLVL